MTPLLVALFITAASTAISNVFSIHNTNLQIILELLIREFMNICSINIAFPTFWSKLLVLIQNTHTC